MSFGNPWAFLFLLLIPVIIGIHYFRRERVLVQSSVFPIWREIFEEVRPKTVWTRILRNLLIYFHIFFVLLSVMALAEISFSEFVSSGKSIVLLIDNSASMNTVEDGVSRLELAKRAAKGFLSRGEKRKVLVLPVIDKYSISKVDLKENTFSTNYSEISSKISRIMPTDFSDDLYSLLKRIYSKDSSMIYYFGDGNQPRTANLLKNTKDMIWVPIGKERENIGITNLSSRFIPQINKEREIRTVIKNFGESPRKTRIELMLNKERLEEKELFLNGREEKSFTFYLAGKRGGILSASLTMKDAYMKDNIVYHVIPEFSPVQIKLITEMYPKRLLEALRIQKDISVEILSAKQFRVRYSGNFAGENMVGIFYKTLPFQTPFLNNIYILPNTDKPFVPSNMLRWQKEHPIIKNLSLNSFFIPEAFHLQFYDDAEIYPILQDGKAKIPLIFSREAGKGKEVFFAFDVETDSFSFQPSFPLLFRRVLSWFKENNAIEKYNLRPGDIFYLPKIISESADSPVVFFNNRKFPVDGDSRNLIFGSTWQTGIYKIKAGKWEKTFSVQPTVEESYIFPGMSVQDSKPYPSISPSMEIPFLKIWKIFAIAAFILLLGEWWYQKREIYALY